MDEPEMTNLTTNFEGQCIITNQEAIEKIKSKEEYSKNLITLLMNAGAPVKKFNVEAYQDLSNGEVFYKLNTVDYEWQHIHEPHNGRMIFKWKKR